MPGPQRHLLNEARICRKSKKKSDFQEPKTMRKIRVLCADPDATDSSSEDEEPHPPPTSARSSPMSLKRIVLEINLPLLSSDSETSFYSTNYKGPKTPKQGLSKKFRKVSECSPLELREQSSSCVLENSETTFLPSSPSSVLDISASALVVEAQSATKEEQPPVEIAEPVKGLLEEPLFELDSLFIDELGTFDDFMALGDMPFFEFGIEENYLGFDFDLDPEAVAWMNL